MIRQAQSEAKLRTLLASGGLPASACGQAFVALIAPLVAGGVLVWQQSGAGRRLVVKDVSALNDFCCLNYPQGALPADVGNRVAGVGRFRDTKAMAGSGIDIIFLRAWREDALLKIGRSVGAAAATAAHGVFSFLLKQKCGYELRGRCALVENPAVFVAAEQLNLGVGLMIYGHGRISARIVEWLTRSNDSDFSLLHLPDYDPTGLSEFQRLHSRLGDRIALHLPTDLEARFARFSNRKLLEKGNSQAMLAQLRRSDLPSVRRVVELIDRYNAGLEQEALLLDLLTDRISTPLHQ
jgi:hypothetical protein